MPGLSEIASAGTLANFSVDSLRNDLQAKNADQKTAKEALVEYHKYFNQPLSGETVKEFLSQFPPVPEEEPEPPST